MPRLLADAINALPDSREKFLEQVRTLDSAGWKNGDITPGIAWEIHKGLLHNSKLSSFSFYHCNISDEGMKALTSVRMPTSLTLWDCQISDTAVAQLAEILQSDTRLVELDLGYSAISPDGIQALARALVTNAALKSLILFHCPVGHAGAKHLAVALAKNTMLEKLDLEYTEIDTSGAVLLSVMLDNNKALLELNLSWNAFGDDGVFAFGDMLKRNSTLQVLDLRMRGITDVPKSHFLDVLTTRNYTLTDLALGDMYFGKRFEDLSSAMLLDRYFPSLNCVLSRNRKISRNAARREEQTWQRAKVFAEGTVHGGRSSLFFVHGASMNTMNTIMSFTR